MVPGSIDNNSENNKPVAVHTSPDIQPVPFVESEQFTLSTFAHSAAGVKTSITTAALLSYVFSIAFVYLASLYPPAKHFIEAQLGFKEVKVQLNKSRHTATLKITNHSPNIDHMIVNFNYGESHLSSFDVIQTEDSFVSVEPIGKRIDPVTGGFRSAFRITNLEESLAFSITFHFVSGVDDFSLSNIVKDGLQIVAEPNDTWLALPNVVYHVLALSALSIFIWIVGTYYISWRIAKKLDTFLDCIHDSIEVSGKNDWHNECFDKWFFEYIDRLLIDSTERSKYIRGYQEGEFRKFIELNLLWMKPESQKGYGRSKLYHCVAPFHILGNPTFARRFMFRRNHILFVELDNQGNISGIQWAKVSNFISA